MTTIEDEAMARLLRTTHRIAIVGLSDKPERPSHRVAAYLQRQGYRIVPVTPVHREILGERCYPSLALIEGPVDLVDVFRRPEEAAAVAREAVAIGARSLWLQLGVISDEARAIAEAAGMPLVMDRCLKIEHARLLGAG